MRIRKNAAANKLLQSSILHSTPSSSSPPPETLQTHVCQLNQSPWDVISFSQEISFQFEEDSFTGNGSSSVFNESNGVVESVASDVEEDDKKVKIDEMIIDEVVEDKVVKTKALATNRRRARAVNKKGSSSSLSANPYEFYYYSGFGPLWGKRRGERVRDDKDDKKMKQIENDDEKIAPMVVEGVYEQDDEYDVVDDDDEEEMSGDCMVKKRMRKPVKARSLKSLM